MTKEEIAKFRRSLEKATEESFRNFAEAKRIAWSKAHRIVLD